MAAPRYGVTVAGIAAEIGTTFATDTPVTSAWVDDVIGQEASKIAGALLAKGVVASSLQSTEDAYGVAAGVLTDFVSARVSRRMQMDPTSTGERQRAADRALDQLLKMTSIFMPEQSAAQTTTVVAAQSDVLAPWYRVTRGGL